MKNNTAKLIRQYDLLKGSFCGKVRENDYGKRKLSNKCKMQAKTMAIFTFEAARIAAVFSDAEPLMSKL